MPIAITTDQPEAEAKPARRYWEERARRFALRNAGLAAVCSYGMPSFYNRHIDILQRAALRPWLQVPAGARVLEVGCGVGRWTTRLAERGCRVTAIDLSATMVAEARRNAVARGVADRCTFCVSDVSQLGVRGQFDVILAVTVLQHQTQQQEWEGAIRDLARLTAPGGRVILLEAAPSRAHGACDHPRFVARTEQSYLDAFRRAGLRTEAVRGVDPAPFKIAFLPSYRRLPQPLANVALLAVTAAGFLVDLAFARWCAAASWHKVFVLTREAESVIEESA